MFAIYGEYSGTMRLEKDGIASYREAEYWLKANKVGQDSANWEIREYHYGAFEALMKDIEAELIEAEGGFKIEEWAGRLCIIQRESRNPRMSNNGGDYYFYKFYKPDGLGVEVWEGWSCDIAPRNEYGGDEQYYDCLISLEGLERMAKLATITIAAKSWLAKEPGCMARLKAAIRALDD